MNGIRNRQGKIVVKASKKWIVKYMRSSEFMHNGKTCWEDDVKLFDFDAESKAQAIEIAEATFRLWNLFSKHGRKYEIRDCEEK